MSTLQTSQSVTVAADGSAQVEIGPGGAWETWLVQRIAVRVDDSAAIPIAEVYRDRVNRASFVDGTATGDSDVADYLDPLRVEPGQRLIVAWAGADPGSVATVTVAGEIVQTGSRTGARR